MRRVLTAIAAVLSLMSMTAPPAVAQRPATERFIVGHAPGQRAGAENALRSAGGRPFDYYETGSFFLVEAPANRPDWVNEVRGSAAVSYVERDQVITVDTHANPSELSSVWGVSKIGAPIAWDTNTGSAATVVGVIDSGIDYNHPDLAGNIWTNPGEVAGNGLDDDGNGYIDDIHGVNCARAPLPGASPVAAYDPQDDNSHGTHVAGTIGALANNGGVVGVNWDVSLMALKFLNSRGSGYTSDAVQCLDYATSLGVRVTNNSWGGGGFSTSLYNAIVRAGNAGALFVAAAGNSSINTDSSPHYPSSYDLSNIVSVASTTSTDGMSSFSNYGAMSVDLGAPGSSIYSTLPGGGYGYKSGTSMASPHVAGAAALLLSQDPSLSWTQLRDAIYSTVTPLASLAGRTATGGRLNLEAALASLAPPPPLPPDPAPPPPPETPVHSADLDATRSAAGGNWKATVTVTVHDDAHAPMSGAVVAFTWSSGATGTCGTSGAGTCTASVTLKKNVSSVSFSVTGITGTGLTYSSTANHDPDTDSDGTLITAIKP